MASSFFHRYRRKRTASSSTTASASPSRSRASSNPSTPTPAPPPCPDLSLFTTLPLELQLYTLSFLPARHVVRSLAAASKHTLSLADAHVRRRLAAIMAEEEGEETDDDEDEDNRRRSRSRSNRRYVETTLVFEAGRPIDTINRRHALFFDGVARGSRLGGDAAMHSGWSSIARFAFVPSLRAPQKGDEVDDLAASLSALSDSSSHPVHIPSRPDFTDVSRPQRSTHMPAVAVVEGSDDAGLKSTVRSPRYRFQLDPLDSFETWILSLTLQRRTGLKRHQQRRRRLAALHPDPDPDPDDAGRPPLSTRVFANSGRGRTAAGMDGSMRFGIMGAPGGDTRSFAIGRDGLEPLGAATSAVMERPMRWEKRVAEGLDRVFRDWFSADRQERPRPHRRLLEFDGPSCVVEIQPRHHEQALSTAVGSASSFNSLSSLSARHAVWSAHRRSSSSSSDEGVDGDSDVEGQGSPSRPALPDGLVELTFSCTAVVIFAARLLAAIEDVEDDVEEARAKARSSGRRSQPMILAGSSGGSSWASSAGGDGEGSRIYRLNGL